MGEFGTGRITERCRVRVLGCSLKMIWFSPIGQNQSISDAMPRFLRVSSPVLVRDATNVQPSSLGRVRSPQPALGFVRFLCRA